MDTSRPHGASAGKSTNKWQLRWSAVADCPFSRGWTPLPADFLCLSTCGLQRRLRLLGVPRLLRGKELVSVAAAHLHNPLAPQQAARGRGGKRPPSTTDRWGGLSQPSPPRGGSLAAHPWTAPPISTTPCRAVETHWLDASTPCGCVSIKHPAAVAQLLLACLFRSHGDGETL